jgi:hypothetical protein
MKGLGSHKQLLIAESELNRAHLIHELQTMAGNVHALVGQAKTISSIASIAAASIAGMSPFRQKTSVPDAEKSSWWQTILKGAEIAGSLSSRFRSQDRAQIK